MGWSGCRDKKRSILGRCFAKERTSICMVTIPKPKGNTNNNQISSNINSSSSRGTNHNHNNRDTSLSNNRDTSLILMHSSSNSSMILMHSSSSSSSHNQPLHPSKNSLRLKRRKRVYDSLGMFGLV